MNPIFVVEDCEPQVFEWSLIEYANISKIVGKDNLWITNTDATEHEAIATIKPNSVTTMDLPHACVLDPFAEQTLTPEIAKKFKYFIFGGIMGDHPPNRKTEEFITKKVKFPAFNIGQGQMPTDNAVLTVKKILEGMKFEDIKTVSSLEVVTGEGESVELPFTYVLVDGQPLIDPKIIEILLREDTF